MKEPVVGCPLLAVLLKGSLEGSVVAVNPHWIEMLKVNVSPVLERLKDWVRSTWFMFCPGVRVMTGLLRMKPSAPVLSMAMMRRLTYSVVVEGFCAPSLKVNRPLYFDRENR